MDKQFFQYAPPIRDGFLADDISIIPTGFISYGCSCPHTKGPFSKRALLVAHIRRHAHREWLNNKSMTQHENNIILEITPQTPIFVPEPEPKPDTEPDTEPEPDAVNTYSTRADIDTDSNEESLYDEILFADFILLKSRVQYLENTVNDLKKQLTRCHIFQAIIFIPITLSCVYKIAFK